MGFTHRLLPGLVALAISASLAACASAVSSTSGSAGETAQATEASATATKSGNESPAPSATQDTRPLQGLLPSDFGGAEAHTFAVGQDMLARLADELRAAPADLQVAFASDHGTAFVQMYALRSAGHGADELLAACLLPLTQMRRPDPSPFRSRRWPDGPSRSSASPPRRRGLARSTAWPMVRC